MTDYQFYKGIGICVDCKKYRIFSGEARCPECRAYHANYMIKFRQKKDKQLEHEKRVLERQKRRENGCCFRCGRKLTDLKYKTCEVCRKRENAWQKKNRLNK